jgi:hypothetical protein
VGPNGAAAPATNIPLINVTLADAAGARVQLGNVLPAVLLLVHGCDCADLIKAIAKAAPPPITILPVAKAAPCAVGTAANVRCLADPDGTLTSRYPAPSGSAGQSSGSPSPPAAPTTTAVLVDANGNASQPATVDSADDLTEAMAKLASGG